MKTIKYLHTAILISNLERSEYFYSQILGLPKVDRSLNFPGVWYQLDDFQIHLIVDRNFKQNTHNLEKWGRNPHLAFAVDNFELARSKLESHNCPIQMSASGRTALFTKDPDDNIIEISQLTPLS